MKPATFKKVSVKINRLSLPFDDETIKYKLNTKYFDNVKPIQKNKALQGKGKIDDEEVRYKFPDKIDTGATIVQKKAKPKPKIKVNFWSNKKAFNRNNEEPTSKRRHTIAINATDTITPKSNAPTLKVRKRVSFLPTPLFSDNHIPMVTVPDDLTINLNEEEANALNADLQAGLTFNSILTKHSPPEAHSDTSSGVRAAKRKKYSENHAAIISHGSDNDLEYFSKYIVQKLRKMETNQRIYSENLINTVLMLGQLGELSAKHKIKSNL